MLGLYSAWVVKVALLEVASKKGDSAKYGSTASETVSELGKALKSQSMGMYRCWCECRPFPVLWGIAIESHPEVAPAPLFKTRCRH